jgi:tRNA(Leu) C34 or U34 (ribose-2'-O)-methylase TrmL
MNRDEAVAILRSPEGRDETRRIYRLGRAFDLALRLIESGGFSRDEAEQMVDAVADLAEQYFPGSAETFSLLYGRRLRRAIADVYGEAD